MGFGRAPLPAVAINAWLAALHPRTQSIANLTALLALGLRTWRQHPWITPRLWQWHSKRSRKTSLIFRMVIGLLDMGSLKSSTILKLVKLPSDAKNSADLCSVFG